ncbi:MAG TPA: hypothetical protein PKD00_09195 [Burkholderiales bacterium]|nr:hypothetical protein [Burkholderiales bacterium]
MENNIKLHFFRKYSCENFNNNVDKKNIMFYSLNEENYKNLNQKEKYFQNILESATVFFKSNENNSGKAWVWHCLAIHKNNVIVEDNSLLCLNDILQIAKNTNSYFLSKVFTRGFQKTLAIGFIRDNTIITDPDEMAFISKKFNYTGFKLWFIKNFGCEMAVNLKKEYFEDITLDDCLNIKFSNNEYKNKYSLTNLVVDTTRLLSLLKNLKNYQGMLTFYDQYQDTIVDDRRVRTEFENNYKEELIQINKANYKYITPENSWGAIGYISSSANLALKIPVSARAGTVEMRGEKLNQEIINYFNNNPNNNLYDMFFTKKYVDIRSVDVFKLAIQAHIEVDYIKFIENNFYLTSSILKTIISRLIYDTIEAQIVPQLKILWQNGE